MGVRREPMPRGSACRARALECVVREHSHAARAGQWAVRRARWKWLPDAEARRKNRRGFQNRKNLG